MQIGGYAGLTIDLDVGFKPLPALRHVQVVARVLCIVAQDELDEGTCVVEDFVDGLAWNSITLQATENLEGEAPAIAAMLDSHPPGQLRIHCPRREDVLDVFKIGAYDRYTQEDALLTFRNRIAY